VCVCVCVCVCLCVCVWCVRACVCVCLCVFVGVCWRNHLEHQMPSGLRLTVQHSLTAASTYRCIACRCTRTCDAICQSKWSRPNGSFACTPPAAPSPSAPSPAVPSPFRPFPRPSHPNSSHPNLPGNGLYPGMRCSLDLSTRCRPRRPCAHSTASSTRAARL
jgi:hypothetical protein